MFVDRSLREDLDGVRQPQQPIEQARRRGHGFWNDKYEERFRQRVALESTIVGKGYAEFRKTRARLRSR